MVIHSPSAAAPATESAQVLIEAVKRHPAGTVFSADETGVAEAFFLARGTTIIQRSRAADLPYPEGTITAFMHMVEYRRNQKQLRKTPALPSDLTSNTAEARLLLRQAIAEGATSLNTHEVSLPADQSGMNTLPTWIASDSTEAVCVLPNRLVIRWR